VLAAVAGELEEMLLRVDECLGKGGERRITRSVVGFKRNHLPASATIWISDATADPADIARLAGREIINRTPPGDIELAHPIYQIAADITQSSAPSRVADAIRTAMKLYSRSVAAGVIAHQRHVPVVRGTAKAGDPLGERLRSRIRTVEHFRGTTSRGFNGWHQDCDLLIVVGTPRVPPAVVRARLQAIGLDAAAQRTEQAAEWTRDYWSAVTVSGRRRTVRTLAYRDHDWHHAYRSLVHAELIQCIGRARAILPEGIPAIVISSEPLGFPVLDLEKPLTESQQEILDAMAEILAGKNSAGQKIGNEPSATFPTAVELSPPFPTGLELWQPFPTAVEGGNMATIPYIYYVGNGCHTAEIVDRVGKSRTHVKAILTELEKSKIVERIGERGGWRFSSPIPSSNPLAPLAAAAVEHPIIRSEEPTP